MRVFVLWVAAAMLILAGSACKRNEGLNLPETFKSLSTDDKMEYLMSRIPADSVARFICNAALGKVYNARIELQPALSYAYSHYGENDLVLFQMSLEQFQEDLPLHEKVTITKMLGIEDIDQYSYDLGLNYVGTIRAEGKTIEQISSELGRLQKECKTDPDFYKRFMKGFKTALNYDRHHDLDDNIYMKFISYPDSLK